jgi:tRNA/tmRNA/rRNA uracil-C5-methylase (TrmA/RlmC/RlmD family)
MEDPRELWKNREVNKTSNWTGQQLTLRIEKVAHGGVFVARHEGRVVFVSHVLPGELVKATVFEDRGGAFCRAEPTHILEASPDRVPHFWKEASAYGSNQELGVGGAGGAEFGHITLQRQRSLKEDVLEEALQRMAGIQLRPQVEAVAGDDDANGLGYRTRVQLKVDEAGEPGPFRERSHEVISVRNLPLAVEEVNELGLHLKNWQGVKKIDIAVSNTGQVQYTVDKKVKGDAKLIERAGGRTFRISSGGFWQVHREAARVLTDTVNSMVAAVGIDVDAPNLDLYGGVGLFAGSLAAKFANRLRITTVEAIRVATDDAKLNLADLPGVRAVCAPTERFTAEQVRLVQAGQADYSKATVVIDPPRSGAGAKVVADLIALAPKHIVYVACDPVALARDLKPLLAGGYQLKQLRAFDLFPHTHHVECVASLVRA